MADRLSWRGLTIGWVLIFGLLLIVAFLFNLLQPAPSPVTAVPTGDGDSVSSSLYAILGFFLLAYDAVNNYIQSAASSAGGGGVLMALLFALIALVMAENASSKVEALSKKVEELEEKLEDIEEDEED